MIKGLITSGLFCCFLSLGFSQQQKQVSYAAFCKEYRTYIELQPTENYSVNVNTAMYANILANKNKTEVAGTFCQGSGSNQSMNNGTKIQVQNSNFRLEIDTVKKQVIVTHPIRAISTKDGISDLIKSCDSTKCSFFKVSENGKVKLIIKELVQQSGNQEVVLEFNEKTKLIQEIDLVYWQGNYTMTELNDETLEQPKIEVKYTGLKKNSGLDANIQETIDSWVKVSKDGLQLAAKHADYELIDLRVNTPRK